VKLWNRLFLTREQRRQSEAAKNDRQQLLQEIVQAHMDWVTAHNRLDFVVEKEQIDYSVYALEAAEKRFEMLMKQAKEANVSAVDFPRGRVMRG
jgi:hypothetical protein